MNIAKSVLIFLASLLAGFLTRTIGEAHKGTEWLSSGSFNASAP
ncbi:MAG: hypothetical protein R2789_14705 [Microthrixaceae bacterium]